MSVVHGRVSVWNSGSFAVTGAVSETVKACVCVCETVLLRDSGVLCACTCVILNDEKGKPKTTIKQEEMGGEIAHQSQTQASLSLSLMALCCFSTSAKIF